MTLLNWVYLFGSCGGRPVIQRADERALAQGVDIFKVFELVRKIRNNVEVPMVFLLYYNVMVQYGIEKFFKRCQETGVDGLIIPDLLMKKAMKSRNIPKNTVYIR